MIFICEFCNKKFEMMPSDKGRGKYNYCSVKCARDDRAHKNVEESVGETIGYLKINSFAYIKNHQSYVNCSCECGKTFQYSLTRIKNCIPKLCLKCQAKHRFMKYVKIINKNTWMWIGYKNKKGYGTFTCKYLKTTLAHRISYILFIGEIENGMCVCHKDDIPANVCPNNFFLATSEENTKDMMNKSRQCKGEGKHSAKLTQNEVIEMRSLHKKEKSSLLQLAKKYNVHIQTIKSILDRKTWKNVGD